MVARALALVAVLSGCGKRETVERTPTTAEKRPVAEGSAAGCEQVTFAESTPVPEASGAAWLTIDGTLSLVVVADSGHAGAFGLLDPDTGETRAQGTLPLGSGAGDDIEGLAARGDRLYGLTSAGFMRVWQWRGGAFQLVDGPYAIGTGDDVCDAMKSNCGRDYEGLAIAPTPAGGCAGFACSRKDGSLYCLAEQSDGTLRVDAGKRIEVETRRMAMSDCAFSEDGTLYTGNNLFGMAQVRRVDGWSAPATATVVELEVLGTGFPEVIAVRGDHVVRMSDLGGSGPSLLAKFRCPTQAR